MGNKQLVTAGVALTVMGLFAGCGTTKVTASSQVTQPHTTNQSAIETATNPVSNVQNAKKSNPSLVTGHNSQILTPNEGAILQVFNITSKAYTDHRHWDVIVGDTKGQPSNGVVISYYFTLSSANSPNGTIHEKIHVIPNAGKISITKFSRDKIYIKSNRGQGTFTLTSENGKLKWKSNS